MSGLTGVWDQLVDAVCRPPRDDSYTDEDLVGGQRASFRLGKARYYRQDLELHNERGERLLCSHFRPCIVASKDGRLPVVVYCHCNSGSRRDAEEIIYHFLPRHVTVFSLDFSGSGRSQGEWVTLGAREVDDVATAVRYLRDEGSALTIGLWGRSMGSVASMLYARADPSIAGLVLDSPFARLRDLMLELGSSDDSLRMPRAIAKVALAVLKRSVRRRAGFSIDDVAPVEAVPAVQCPALFGHGAEDTFVSAEHSRRLVRAYGGEARLRLFDGDHNSVRPDDFYEEAVGFMLSALRVEELLGFDVFLMDPAAAGAALSSGAGAPRARRLGRGGAAGGGGPTAAAAELAADEEDDALAAALALSMQERRAGRDAGALPLSEEAELALAVELSLQTSLLVRCTEPEPEDERGASPPTSPVAQRSAAQHAYKEEAAVRAVVGSGEGAAGSPPPPPKQEHVEDGPGSAGPQQAS
ncbi:hypothetical protein ACKKBF_B04825 [Auxenochlorella protothecoides x Auxenochlorella symbiontica]